MNCFRALTLCLAWAALVATPVPARKARLPGVASADSGIGLAAASGLVYAAYWAKAGDHPWPLVVVAIDSSTGQVVARSRLESRAPLRTRNGKVIPPDAKLYISPDGSALLCVNPNSGMAWALRSSDLQVASRAKIAGDAAVAGFTAAGTLRTFVAHADPRTGEIRSVEVTDRDLNSLTRVVDRRTIELPEPALDLTLPDAERVVWALDARRSRSGDARVSAYSIKSGKTLSTWRIPNDRAEEGTPPLTPASRGRALPPPTGAVFAGDANAGLEPQLAQLQPAGRGMALVVLDQPSLGWKQWSRVARLEIGTPAVALSEPLQGCDLHIDAVGPASRLAVGSCDRVGRSGFDEYAVESAKAVVTFVATGKILATVPLKRNWGAVALSVDDTVNPAVVGIYDHRSELRFIRVSLPGS